MYVLKSNKLTDVLLSYLSITAIAKRNIWWSCYKLLK